MRTKRMPVLPTDRNTKNESAHVAKRSQCKTEDSRKHLENESSVPRVAMDCGFLAHSTDADLVANITARRKPVRCPTKPQSLVRSVVCLKSLTRMAGDDASAAQTLVDPVWVGRDERKMPERSSKCSHQSSGAGENGVRNIESSARTNDSVLPEGFGCRANSKGIVPPWVSGCVAHVLHRSEKRDDDHNARVWSKMRLLRDVLTKDGGTADAGDQRGEMATLGPGRATGNSLGRTDANDKRPSQRCTTSEQWQPGAFSSPTSVPWNGGKLALKPMMDHRKKYVSKSFIQRKSETFGCSEKKGILSRRVSERR